MTETIKLYDNDAYLRNFRATVLSCEHSGDGYAIILDRTAFFPEGGGQTADTGTLLAAADDEGGLRTEGTAATIPGSGGLRTEGDAAMIPGSDGPRTGAAVAVFGTDGLQPEGTAIHVTDVQITGGIITHYCDGPLAVGTTITGSIDWTHRYSNMQQHTGEHIFSGVVHQALGYENVGFHLSDHVVTMDYDGPLSDEQVEEFERQTNEWIQRNVAVSAYYPSVEKLSHIDYRSKDGITGAIRIVAIEGCDTCACCAPHVARTGEVGILKVVDHVPYKGGVRLSILCGMRALADYRKKQDVISSLSRLLSKPEDELVARTNALFAERDEARQALYLAQESLLHVMMDALPTDADNACLFIERCDTNLARKAVNDLAARHAGYCMVCTGTDETGYSFILGSASGAAKDAATLLRESLSAKCGGSDLMIQGQVQATAAAIRKLFEGQGPA